MPLLNHVSAFTCACTHTHTHTHRVNPLKTGPSVNENSLKNPDTSLHRSCDLHIV